MRKSLFLIAFLTILQALLFADDSPSRVLVVYRTNQSDMDSNGVSDSRDLALYYQHKRGIPEQNMLGVATSTDRTYNLAAQLPLFYSELVAPIRQKIEAIGIDSILYIVLCKGIPYAVCRKNGATYSTNYPVCENLAALYAIGDDTSNSAINPGTNPMYEPSPTIGTDKGRFDATYQINGTRMFLVTELDAMTFQLAKELVDRALYAERYVGVTTGARWYTGIGYVDTRYGKYTDNEFQTQYPKGYGAYDLADFDMGMASQFILNAGFELKWENTLLDDATDGKGFEIGDSGALYHDGSSALTAPNALFYGGWYNLSKYNRFAWTWMPGAVVCDLNSNSLSTTSPGCFSGGALYYGATAACGVLDEPYLSGHTQPEKLLYYILNGSNFAEAAYHAEPTLGWKTRNVGDPIYNPLKPKTAIQDTVAPPLPMVENWPLYNNKTQRRIRVSINTDNREPDLVLCQLRYGKTTDYDSIFNYANYATHATVYKMVHDIDLRNLDSNQTYHCEITLKDPVGNTTTTNDFTFFTSGTGSESSPALTAAVRLEAFPNPFNSSVKISADSWQQAVGSETIHLQIYDIQGKIVYKLPTAHFQLPAELTWDASRFSSGVYWCVLSAGNKRLSALRLVLLK